jgi:hypothetical protein
MGLCCVETAGSRTVAAKTMGRPATQAVAAAVADCMRRECSVLGLGMDLGMSVDGPVGGGLREGDVDCSIEVDSRTAQWVSWDKDCAHWPC